MLKLIIIILLIFHGLIHITGTLTEFNLLEMEDFSGKTIIPLSDTTKKILGIVWVIVMITFQVAAYGLFTDQDWWQTLSWISIIISQILITIWWPDAKFGTIANALIVLGMYYHNN